MDKDRWKSWLICTDTIDIARGYKDISPKAEALQEEAIQKEANEATLMYMAEQNADFSTLRAMQVHSGSGEWTTQADASCTQIDEERAELLKGEYSIPYPPLYLLIYTSLPEWTGQPQVCTTSGGACTRECVCRTPGGNPCAHRQATRRRRNSVTWSDRALEGRIAGNGRNRTNISAIDPKRPRHA